MVIQNSPFNSTQYPMQGMYQQMPMTPGTQGMYQQTPMTPAGQGPESYLVPGITPQPFAPGGFGAPSAGSPAPLSFGTNLPPQQAAQMYGQTFGPGTTQQQPFGQTAGTGAQESPFTTAPGSPTLLGTEYTQGFLRTQIGQNVRIEFLLGTSSLVDRRGTLLSVGIDYVLLREQDTDDLLLCDIYSIKFVTIYK